MGTFTIGFLLKNHVHREKSVRIPHLIGDAGSEATWIPRKELAKADIKPEKRQTFQMANGQWIYRDVGYAIQGKGGPAPRVPMSPKTTGKTGT